MKIALVSDFFYPRLGGVEMHIYSLAQCLIAQGHKVIVVTHAYQTKSTSTSTSTNDKGKRAKSKRTGVRYLPGPLKVYYCPILPMVDEDALPTFSATFPLLRYIFVREGIDVVHAHQATSTLANEAVAYATALNIPSVYTDHSLFGFDDIASVVLNRVLKATLSTVNAVICVSHTCRENLIMRASIDPTLVHAIPNAIDAKKFQPKHYQHDDGDDTDEDCGNEIIGIRQRHQQASMLSSSSHQSSPTTQQQNRIKIVVVSRLVYRKGVDLLVGIIPLICRQFDHVDFIIGGDGAKKLCLEEMVEAERLQHRVTFLGSVPHAQVRNVLVQGHIFLNCSLTESFCIAILEAASCGLFVVSTEVGGVPEVLPHDLILMGPPNVQALAQVLAKAIMTKTCPASHDPIQAHERIKRMYSWDRVAKKTVQVYESVLNQSPLTFLQRLARYRTVGPMAGLVVCVIAVSLHFWVNLVEWMQPRHCIDVVPDLKPFKAEESSIECHGKNGGNSGHGDYADLNSTKSKVIRR